MKTLLQFLAIISAFSIYSNTLIPMDEEQSDHLMAYGVVFRMLEKNYDVHWLLDYRGGSFIIENDAEAKDDALKSGVRYIIIDGAEKEIILAKMNENGMKDMLLEKAPKIAVYSPPGKEPWDDAVTLVLDYAKIPYEVIYDKEILNGKVYQYDWLHLHHEDFTGQFDRFYISSYYETWFQSMLDMQKKLSAELGYKKYWEMKRDVASAIAEYVKRGGFLFAMCSGTNTVDDALAIGKQDIITALLDQDGTVKPTYDYSRTFAFENFTLNESFTMNIDDINYEPQIVTLWEGQKFKLNKFASKTDPVEAMLTQNHTDYVSEFMGRTTSFSKSKIKNSTVILADACDNGYAKYIHGVYGEGFFTFLAGHDPEDYVHYVNDKPTELIYHKHSPGYRLILNNVLFPASQEKKKKT